MQEFWDTQFKFSQILPDFADRLEQMAADSAAMTQDHKFSRESYGSDCRQWVEWIAGSGPKAVLPVIIHGGYWRALRAEDHRFMMTAFAPFGAHVANIEYRLMPEVSLADIVQDARLALGKLCDAFPDAQLLLIGHSAGAHLAISALQNSALKAQCNGVIAISGVYDLEPVAQSFLQVDLALSPADIAAFSLTADISRPPVLYVNGSAETHEFMRGGALMASHGAAAWHVIDGADHMSVTWAACDAAADLIHSVMKLKVPS